MMIMIMVVWHQRQEVEEEEEEEDDVLPPPAEDRVTAACQHSGRVSSCAQLFSFLFWLESVVAVGRTVRDCHEVLFSTPAEY